mmetsp:Transcript_34157/g.59671  ORF Transcript_34157/g.59671 Transcript_34157/m.59671 type:complete len:150 (-) Transcript_34157:2332-2781(-)
MVQQGLAVDEEVVVAVAAFDDLAGDLWSFLAAGNMGDVLSVLVDGMVFLERTPREVDFVDLVGAEHSFLHFISPKRKNRLMAQGLHHKVPNPKLVVPLAQVGGKESQVVRGLTKFITQVAGTLKAGQKFKQAPSHICSHSRLLFDEDSS